MSEEGVTYQGVEKWRIIQIRDRSIAILVDGVSSSNFKGQPILLSAGLILEREGTSKIGVYRQTSSLCQVGIVK